MNTIHVPSLHHFLRLTIASIPALMPVVAAAADEEPATRSDTHAMAQDLKNPVSNLTLVPLQSNFEFGPGPDHLFRYTLNTQPVIPIPLNEDWRLITRTVVPTVYQELPDGDEVSGLSDTELSFFLSPAEKSNGFVWGAGSVLEFPTATDDLLGARKWGAGPTTVFLKESGGWTAGLLLNHLWSFAGAGIADVSDTFIDAWLSHTWENGFAVNLESESHYDWEGGQATIPIRAGVSQLVTLGEQPVQFNLDGLYYLERAPAAPRWGVSLTVTFIFQ